LLLRLRSLVDDRCCRVGRGVESVDCWRSRRWKLGRCPVPPQMVPPPERSLRPECQEPEPHRDQGRNKPPDPGKVARRAVANEISALLDSPEVAALIAELEALRWTGRRSYGPRTLVGACLIKSLYGFTTWTRVAALIADHPGLQAAIGGCPSVFACYRFATKLREHSNVLADCLDRIAASLQAELPDIDRDVAIGCDQP
jgi:hypothetical protein